MLNIDFLTLKAFYIENADFIINSRLQKIQQPTRRDFIFYLRNNGKSQKLYININPQLYHISFMSPENEKRRNLIIPSKPPMFCMLLRKYIEGAKISDARVIDGERILELHFETYDEIGNRRLLILAIELMGKHSNVILYDSETSVIIGCAHNVGAEKSRYRELQGGLKYILPPSCEAGFSNELKKEFSGLDSKKIKEYLQAETFRPASTNEKYTIFKELLPDSVPENSVNAMLDNYYSLFQEKKNIESEKSFLRENILSKLKKNKTSIDKINLLLKKRDNAEKYKLYGELLTANLYKKADYSKSIEVFDYINHENITIDLDSTMTLNENAQRYYKLYSKSKLTKEKSSVMLLKLNQEKEYLENVLYSIDLASNYSELSEIMQELGLTEKESKNKKNIVNITKLEINGFEVYLGKNNKQNDYIVSKLAKDEDYWFHTRTCAGAHVLLKVNGIKPSEEIIFECCKLARTYSSAKQPSKVGVIYTKAKYLKKPPAAPLGYVTYKNEKEVLI